MRLPHYRLETYGFRVTNGEATLAYTGDTGPSERIAELARDADLFVCEATLETGEADGEPRGHLSAEEALDAYAASGARSLLLTHRPSELPARTASSSRTTGWRSRSCRNRCGPATEPRPGSARPEVVETADGAAHPGPDEARARIGRVGHAPQPRPRRATLEPRL